MKKKSVHTLLLPIMVICLFQSSYSQQNDAGLWLSIELEKLLTSKTSLEFKHTERFGQNITQWTLSYTDLGLSHHFNKHIEISANYRFINKFSPEYSVSMRHRFYGDLVLKKKLQPFVLAFRQRFQNQLEDVFTSEEGQIPSYYTRSKITIKYPINRFKPYVASELYFKLVPGEQPLPNRYRIFGGCAYSMNKTNDLDMYYLFDRRFNQKDPLTNYVIGICYKHTFY